MRTGVPTGKRKLKMMDQIARNDLSHFTDAEIEAIRAYLQEQALKRTQ